MKRILKYLFGSILVILIVAITFLTTLFLGGFGKIYSKKELLNIKNESATLVLSNEGEIIGKFFKENRTNVPFDSLPKHLIDALIATEDARFYEHEGVDGIALIRVLFKSIILGDRSSGGGSTISQQLAKNLFGRKNYGKLSIGVNKLKEVVLANRLEDLYTKEEIIALYFNTVPFGENVYGIEAAAQRFFSSSVEDLKVEEAALLVGMLKANSKYNPRVNPNLAKDRRSVVLNQMNKYNLLTSRDLDSIKSLPLELHYNNLNSQGKAPYFMDQVKQELSAILENINQKDENNYDLYKDGLEVTTTLDLNLQVAAQKAVKTHLSKMQFYLDKLYLQGKAKSTIQKLAIKIAKQNKIILKEATTIERSLFHWEGEQIQKLTIEDSIIYTLKQLHAGILALNPKDGAIKSWLGGISFKYYPYDQVLAKRQLASTFKPILYAEAIRSGRELCDYISNEPIVLNDYDDWSPQNYDGESGGVYSLAAALAKSKNIPTVHLYFESDLEKLNQLWNDLGFIENLNEGPSVILGTNSVSLLELSIAYAAFANGGFLIDPYTIESVRDEKGKLIYEKKKEKPKRILQTSVASKINTILQKAINEGTGRAIRSTYGLKIPIAGKTGTSQNYSDAWFVGYNSNILIASRAGASYPNIHFNNGAYGSGSSLALPLVALTLKEAIKDEKTKIDLSNGSLSSIQLENCPDFKEADIIDQLFDVFKKKKSTLENEQKKAKKKKKVKGFFKKVFGD